MKKGLIAAHRNFFVILSHRRSITVGPVALEIFFNFIALPFAGNRLVN